MVHLELEWRRLDGVLSELMVNQLSGLYVIFSDQKQENRRIFTLSLRSEI